VEGAEVPNKLVTRQALQQYSGVSSDTFKGLRQYLSHLQSFVIIIIILLFFFLNQIGAFIWQHSCVCTWYAFFIEPSIFNLQDWGRFYLTALLFILTATPSEIGYLDRGRY